MCSWVLKAIVDHRVMAKDTHTQSMEKKKMHTCYSERSRENSHEPVLNQRVTAKPWPLPTSRRGIIHSAISHDRTKTGQIRTPHSTRTFANLKTIHQVGREFALSHNVGTNTHQNERTAHDMLLSEPHRSGQQAIVRVPFQQPGLVGAP